MASICLVLLNWCPSQLFAGPCDTGGLPELGAVRGQRAILCRTFNSEMYNMQLGLGNMTFDVPWPNHTDLLLDVLKLSRVATPWIPVQGLLSHWGHTNKDNYWPQRDAEGNIVNSDTYGAVYRKTTLSFLKNFQVSCLVHQWDV